MKLTFLAPANKHMRLAKTISPTATDAYPNVAKLDSHEYEVEPTAAGMRLKADLISQHAAQGHAMLKGNLTHTLVNESRAGKSDRGELTQSLILDVDNLILDNINIPDNLNRRELVILAEKFITILPACFHEASYIVQASASMGLKSGLNMHIEFFLTRELSPRFLKDLLIHLNLTIEALKCKAELSAAGTSLKWKLDAALADNSRIVYIAPPKFVDMQDPFESDKERIEVVEKGRELLNLDSVLAEVNAERIADGKRKLVASLRSQMGLPKKIEKLKPIKIDGEQEMVVVNPDQIRLHFVREDGPYLRFNREIIGAGVGDSVAYYVKKSCPSVVFNFKGETPFLLQEADLDTYNWVIDNFAQLGNKSVGRPFVFNDLKTDRLFRGFYDPTNNLLKEIYEVKREASIPNFFADYGFAAPEIIPQWYYEYDPPNPPGIDQNNRRVNAYIPSKYFMENDTQIEPPQPFGSFHVDVAKHCPTIYKIVAHSTGSDPEAFERFVNWLARIAQTRNKARTAWILHGTQGTGKGMLFSNILFPLFGEDNCSAKQQDNIEDDFNKWVTDKLLVILDDFSIEDCASPGAFDAKLKRLVTEVNTTSRGMRTDQVGAKSYLSMIITSNKFTVVYIPEDDRRFNVAPRQEAKILQKHPTIINELALIPEELPYFAKFLCELTVNEEAAIDVWDNPARRKLQATSKNTVEEFMYHFREGDLEYFIALLEEEALSTTDTDRKIRVDSMILNCIRHAGNRMIFRANDLTLLYCYLNRTPTIMSTKKFAKMLQHHGIHRENSRAAIAAHKGEAEFTKGYVVEWNYDDIRLQKLKKQYLPEEQGKAVKKPAMAFPQL